MKNLQKTSMAFTLIELVVSITILSVILMSVFTIYSNLISVNKRLQIMRTVQENSRSITEQIASDIREKWIDMSYYDGSSTDRTLDYTGSGTRVLAIQWGIEYYAMKKNITGITTICSDADMANPIIHCSMGKEELLPLPGTKTPLSDDQVRIHNARFFISGDLWTVDPLLARSAKATIVVSLGIENTAWVNSIIAKNAQMQIETTVSEKVYKN